MSNNSSDVKTKKGISIPNLYRISKVLKTPINKFFEE